MARPVVILVGAMLAAVIAIFLAGELSNSFSHESTDNAFLDGPVVALAPRVAGRVLAVHVTDNQRVKAGDLLIELDPRDFEVALDQKRAAANAAQSNQEYLKASLGVSEAQEQSQAAVAAESAADVSASEASAQKARADFERAKTLLSDKTISQQEFDAAKAAVDSAEAALKAAQEKLASNRSKMAETRAQTEASRKALQRGEALARQADTEVKAAELNLSYCKINAPQDGRITKKAVEPGDYVQIGQRMLALVSNDLWVTANFKETQLKQIRVGQRVEVSIDSVKGGDFPARVESIQAGSGAHFSMLPPENAVGNYVKVVQRVPVKIVFDHPISSEHTLGPGMSVVPSVRVSDQELAEWAKIAIGLLAGLIVGSLWWMVTKPKREPESDLD